MVAWFWLLAAAIAEVGWVTGLNAADTPLTWAATAVCVVASFGLALLAARQMAATTVYILFVGMGACGTVAVDITAFDAPLHASTLAWLALLLGAIAGLKLIGRPSRRDSAS